LALTSYELAQAVIWIALFILVAGPVHECAHALAAWRLGDGTARMYGRISLDPIRHFDPVGGSVLIFSALLWGVGFGWAKPTPVNPHFLRGRYANSIVAAAGPISNLLLAAGFAIGYRILDAQGVPANNESAINMLQLVLRTGVVLNVVLMVFNLIPVAPLDGSHVLLDMLDYRTARQVSEFMAQYGLLLLVVVIFFAWRVMWPIVVPLINLLLGAQIYYV
jgi:Zn-dependent protease